MSDSKAKSLTLKPKPSKNLILTATNLGLHPSSVIDAYNIDFSLNKDLWLTVNKFVGPTDVDSMLKYVANDQKNEENYWKWAANYLFGEEEKDVAAFKKKYEGKMCERCNQSNEVMVHDYYEGAPKICKTCEEGNKKLQYRNVMALNEEYGLLPEHYDGKAVSTKTRYYTMNAMTMEDVEALAVEVHGSLEECMRKLDLAAEAKSNK